MTGAEPLCWEEDGVAKGIEVEIAEYIVSRLGLNFEPHFYPWARAQVMLKDGDLDCIITTPTDSRWSVTVNSLCR